MYTYLLHPFLVTHLRFFVLFSRKLSFNPFQPFLDLFLNRLPKHSLNHRFQVLAPKPFVGTVCNYKTLCSHYLDQQNPLDTSRFSIPFMQLKSHPRNLFGLQQPRFCSSEGMGGDHSIHSYLSVMFMLFSLCSSLDT